MKKSVTLAAALLVGWVLASTLALASDADQAFKKCQSDAEADDVASADQKVYISNCMKEMGISLEDVNTLVDAEFPASKSAKKASPEPESDD